ncbi:MAG: transporter substrate-binding domain-containing protein [Lentisphaerae bacterium]|nr:transporter substrate-binding domain-containing protein [Lentisphaerota bacterium]
MKYFNLFILALLLCFCGCKEQRKPKLVMVTNAEFPPYEYISGQKIVGIDPEIIRIIADKLGYELEIQNMNFDSVIAAVQSGKADIAASGLTITEERKKQVNFTVPYVIARQLVLVRKDSSLQDYSQLRTMRIGVQHGTTGDLYVAQNIKNPERFSSGPVAVAALTSGKLDVVVIDSEPAKVFALQNPELKIMPEPLTFEEYAFAVNKKNPELLEKINAELNLLLKSGEVDRVIKHYKEQNNTSAQETVVDETESFWRGVKESFQLNFVKDNRYLYLFNGFWVTLKITFFSTLLGIVIGYAVAIVRCTATQTGKMKFADFLCKIYLTVVRGTPVVVQLLIIYFVIFGSVNVDKVVVAIIAFGINSGAYVAEIIRGGLLAVDKGQMEAGRSLGLSYSQTMRAIIIPQGFKNVLPALGNEFIVLLKETSVAGYIALQDLTKGGDIIRSQTYDAFFPLIAVAIIYLAVVMLLSWLLGRLEKRLKRNE